MSAVAKDTSMLENQLQKQRRTVDFDTYDITVRQLLSMLNDGAIDVAPVYQRQFRWDHIRCAQLIESILLGVPVPSLFMATNKDSSWELVDGVQRLSALAKFAGDEKCRGQLQITSLLRLEGLEKLTEFNGFLFSELPRSIQLQFELRPIKVVTLSDKSDPVVRFDLFERLNTGGIVLTDQEIRNCVYRGRFSDFLEEMSKDEYFAKIVRLTDKQKNDGTREECVLRFFAYLGRYRDFVHSVKGFLNDFMRDATKSFDYDEGRRIFTRTFRSLATILPGGIRRPQRKGTSSLILYEGVSVGAALAIKKRNKLVAKRVKEWLGSDDLRRNTTGATNNTAAVRGRIEFCRDRFMGK